MRRLLLLIIMTVLGASCFLGRPPLTVRLTGSTATVDVRTLGEYPTNVARVRLLDTTDGKVIWEVKARDANAQIWRITLGVGANPAMPVEVSHGSYRLVVPTTDNGFSMASGREYEVEVWGTERRWSRGSSRFEFVNS